MRKNCYKRKDGRWQYSKQKGGYRYYAIANTYRELIEKIPKIKPILITDIKHKNRKTNQFTFVQYYQFYIDNFVKNKKIGKETIKSWQRQLIQDITPNFKYLKLEDVTTEKVQNFIDKIPFERKQETIFQRISKVLKKAYATDKIKKDITLGIEKPKRQHKQERNPLTIVEQIKLLKEVKKNKKLYPFVVFSIIVGSRREETLKFNINDIDEKKQTIHIKGTKTNNADRIVYVTKEFINFLKTNLPKGKFEFSKTYPTNYLGEIFKRLNINACLHSLRHTCSANLYFLGANDKYRQMQLGHASIVTTNDIYTNIKENISKRYLRLVYRDLYPKFD